MRGGLNATGVGRFDSWNKGEDCDAGLSHTYGSYASNTLTSCCVIIRMIAICPVLTMLLCGYLPQQGAQIILEPE